MRVILFDNSSWRRNFFPLTLTRPVSNLRVGILTIDEKWRKYLQASVSFITEEFLCHKFPAYNGIDPVILIKGNLLPDTGLADAIGNLKEGEQLSANGQLLAVCTSLSNIAVNSLFDGVGGSIYKTIPYDGMIDEINFPEDIFVKNGNEIRKDFALLTKGRTSAPLAASNRILGNDIFLEEGAKAELATFNTLEGPVYLGKSSEVWEGSSIRGPFALCDGSIVKMGAKIYSNVTVGPKSKVGGELNTSVIWGNTNKGHDGYMGSSVIGEWCNWGAGTTNSNMKNNFRNVRVYDYASNAYRETNLPFCGITMGDHVRCAINTSFNTGTVVGLGSNVFGSGVYPTFIPDFSWGDGDAGDRYDMEKFLQTTELLFNRRSCKFDDIEKNLLKNVYNLTKR